MKSEDHVEKTQVDREAILCILRTSKGSKLSRHRTSLRWPLTPTLLNPSSHLMHRNVIRLLPRQRQQRCAPRAKQLSGSRAYSAFDHQPSTANQTTSSAQETPDDGEQQQHQHHSIDPDQLRADLQTLDQKTLLDTKVKLNALIAHFETLQSTLPSLLPPTHTYEPPPPTSKKSKSLAKKDHANTYKYHVPAHRHLRATLASNLQSALAATTHTRAHIHDLQGADYGVPGDSLAGFREEIGRLTDSEKRDRLKDMRLEEVAEMRRIQNYAERNLGVAQGIRDRGEVARKEGREGEEGSGRDGKVRGKDGKEVGAGKKEGEGGVDLAEMQRQLSAEMMK